MHSNSLEKLSFSEPRQPFFSESAQGFFLRLAVSNGRYELSKLAQAINYKSMSSSFYLGGTDFTSFLTALSGPLDLSDDELVAHFSMPSCIKDDKRAIKDIRLPTPKICPNCMNHEHSRFIKEPSEYAHHTHCEEHEIALIDRCPNCLESLSWSGDIFEGCACCDFKWKSYKAVKEPLPLYQTICSELSSLELNEYLSALYQNLIFISRPFDLSFDKFRQLPIGLFNIPFLFELAFAVTMSGEVKANWEEMRLSHFRNDSKLNCLDEYSLQTLAKIPWPVFSCEHIKAELHAQQDQCLLPLRQREMVSAKRVKNSNFVSDYQYQISLSKSAKLLGVNKESMNGLVELNLVSAYTGSLTSRTRIISGSSVAKLISTMTVHSIKITNPQSQLISIKKLMKILPYFNCDLPCLIKIITDKKCQTYMSDGVKFSLPSLLIDRGEIALHLEQFFVESIRLNLTRSKLRQICSLKVRQFSEFKITFNLQEVGTAGSLTRFNPIQMSAFFDKYVLINRWAKITGIELKSIIQFLKGETGLVPNSILEHQDVFIFEKSDQLLESLTKYVLYHRREIHFLDNICI